ILRRRGGTAGRGASRPGRAGSGASDAVDRHRPGRGRGSGPPAGRPPSLMPGKGLFDKLVAAAVAAACAFVAAVALLATLFYMLLMVVPPAGAAAITAAVAAIAGGIVAAVFLKRARGDDEELDDEPMGLGERAFVLFRNRPVLATVAALAGGWIFLRNPALATMVAAAFTEKSHGRRRR